MDSKPIVAGLLVKRLEVLKEISELERETRSKVRAHRKAVERIDQAIELFEPSVVLAKRNQTMGARSEHFANGELTRRCQTAFRESDGKPVTADQIAVQAMRDKRLDMGDGELRQDITRRFVWTLNRLMTRGAVVKEGWGADARWKLPVRD